MKGSTILSNSNLSKDWARRLVGNSGLTALILAMSMPANAFQIPTWHAPSLTNISKAFSPEALNKLDYALEIGKSLGRNYIIPGAKNFPTVVSNAFTGTLNQFSNITNQFSTIVNQCLPVIKEVITRNPFIAASAIALPVVDFLIRLHYSLVDSANMQIVREAMANEDFFNKAGCKEEILEYRAEEEESLSADGSTSSKSKHQYKNRRKKEIQLERELEKFLTRSLKASCQDKYMQQVLNEYLILATSKGLDWIKDNPRELGGNYSDAIEKMRSHVAEKARKELESSYSAQELKKFCSKYAIGNYDTFLDNYIKYVTGGICKLIYKKSVKYHSVIDKDKGSAYNKIYDVIRNKFSTQKIIEYLEIETRRHSPGRSLFAFLTGKGQNEKVQEVIKNTIDKYLTSATIESMIWIKKNPDSLRVNTQGDVDDKIKQMQGDIRVKMLNLENIAEKYKEFWLEGADDGSNSFLAKYIECVTPAICRFIYSLSKYTPLNEVRDGKFILEITDAVKQEFDTQKIIDILYKR